MDFIDAIYNTLQVTRYTDIFISLCLHRLQPFISNQLKYSGEVSQELVLSANVVSQCQNSLTWPEIATA